MTRQRVRRSLLIISATVAVLSLGSVAVVMALAFNNGVAPAWITLLALYGLPVAFLAMLFLVIDGVAARRRAHGPGEG